MPNDVVFIDHPPRVFVVGLTTPVDGAFQEYLAYRGETWNTEANLDTEAVIEAAGRLCYCSWENKAKRSRRQYIQEQIIGRGHHSVLEHVTVNLLCADVPRHTQLEFVRHRVGVAYSWESTRFTNKHLRFVIPPRIRQDAQAVAAFKETCLQAVSVYRELMQRAKRETDKGTLARKRALEAARAVLPNALGSDGMVTLNVRALRHIIRLRASVEADLSIREFAHAIFESVRHVLPRSLDDAQECLTEADASPIVEFGFDT